LNAVAGALKGVPAAMRRYDIVNIVSVIVGSLNSLGIVLAVWLGFGLSGTVMAQLISSVLASTCFGVIAWRLLQSLPNFEVGFDVRKSMVRELISFSTLLFVGEIGANIGLRIDRTLIGIFLGTTAVTYYIVPTKITDKIPSFMASFATAFYPLSAEALAQDNLAELKRLYLKAAKSLLWLSILLAVLLAVLSEEFLLLWIGPEFATKSRMVLLLLAAASVWRAPAGLAHQVAIGLGRSDVSMWVGWLTLLSLSVPIVALTPMLGINGASLGMFIGMIPVNVFYDLFVQRRLLHQVDWWVSLSLYVKPILVGLVIVILFWNLSFEQVWFQLTVKATGSILGFIVGMCILDRPFVENLIQRLCDRLMRNEAIS
jgi:O-antigen/teichoic acid export membrane protein